MDELEIVLWSVVAGVVIALVILITLAGGA